MYSRETMTRPDSIQLRRFGPRVAFVILTFVASASVFAQAAGTAPTDVGQARKERLEALREQTRTLRSTAESDYRAEIAECQNRILVNDCISQARQRRLGRVEAARKLEAEESAIGREAKRAELAERRARKAQSLANRPQPEITTSPETPAVQ